MKGLSFSPGSVGRSRATRRHGHTDTLSPGHA